MKFGDNMKTIKNDTIYEYIIKKSKFITYLYYIEDEDDAKAKIEFINKEHKDATHCCFGYVVDNVVRFSDDGEPGGTAGMPILNVLTNNDLNHVLAIVVRYFGGIKLGAGGLVRAYSNAVVDSLKETMIVDLIPGYKVNISFTHNNIKTIDNYLKKYNLEITKNYDNNVVYSFLISTNDYLELEGSIKNYCISLEIEKNALIK